MKGPFATYEAAMEAAEEGDHIMTRNPEYHPNAAWGVMESFEVAIEKAKGAWSPWSYWEQKTVAA